MTSVTAESGTALPVRAARLVRGLTLLLAVVAAAELTVARGLLFVRHERLRAGLPRAMDAWSELGSYVTTFTGLLAVVTVLALGWRLAVSRFPSAGRGLALGFAVTIAALGITALFVPPEVRGIITVHLAVVLGGVTLGGVAVLSRADWDVKLAAGAPLLLPPLATAALALQGSARGPLSLTLVVTGTAVAVALVCAAVRRVRDLPRTLLLAGLAHALVVGCLTATAAVLQPRRVVEFLLFSHGLLLDFRGALAVPPLVVLAVAFAAAACVLTPGDGARGRGDGRLLGFGLLLSLLAGPTPLNVTQSLVLAAGSLALVCGVLDDERSVPLDSGESEPPPAEDAPSATTSGEPAAPTTRETGP